MEPLQGYKVLELAGIGPGPMAAMLLADMGAQVLRVERKEEAGLSAEASRIRCTLRSRNAIALDLKDPDDIKRVLKLVSKADALIEGSGPV